MSDSKPLSKIEKIAIASSALIIGVGIIYWFSQVMNVIELLEMAYG